jgi:hypothetical protein
VQQPDLASATPLADFSAQQATFGVQQFAFFSTVLAEQQPATFAAAFVGPQHAFASLQQAKPSVQHFWTAAQQPLFSAQHFSPFSQQRSRASAEQQALFSLQQASLAEQQSLGFSSAATAPVSSRPRARNEPANSFLNMEFLQKMSCEESAVTAHTLSAATGHQAETQLISEKGGAVCRLAAPYAKENLQVWTRTDGGELRIAA